MSRETLGALDIGGTHVTAALVDVAERAVVASTRQRRPVDAQADADTVLSTIAAAAHAAAGDTAAPWGVAIPGPFDYRRGIGDFTGVAKFGSLRGVDVGRALRRSGVGTRHGVHFLNDAAAFATGEWIAGAAAGRERVVALTLGTGVGSCFLVGGEPVLEGPGVAPEGRLDLLQLDGLPLERSISRAAICELYRAASRSGEGLDVREIAERARAGEAHAAGAIAGPMRSLGRVLGPMATSFGADAIVVGGLIAVAWDVIQPPLRSGLEEGAPGWARSCALRRARHLDVAALLGAAWSAAHRLPAD